VALLWAAYRVLFINSNRLTFNRAFLIIALGFSLILPAAGFYIGRSTPQIVSYRQSLFSGIMLDEIVITADGVVINTSNEVSTEGNIDVAPAQAPTQKFNIWKYIWIIYIIGVCVMTALFLVKFARIAIMIIRSPKKKMPGYTAVFTGKEHGSYSFFNYAFFPDENVSEEIVRHEMSHIAHHHSADILFVELMMIIQWFNPFIYLYKRELQSIHEYMADRDVVATGIDKQNYMMLILQQCTAVDFSNMSNNFSFLLTKKRIKMITQNKKAKGVVIKALLTLPLFALLLFANCKSNGNEKPAEKKAVEATETVETQAVETVVNDDSEVYGSVEVMPEYPGGTTAMFEFIWKNLKYPESAKEKGLEGRVFIGFVVEKDGSLSSFQVLRGVCDEIDAEAIKVLEAMPNWKPGMMEGKPVRVQFTMPFNFKLSGNENNLTPLSGTQWEGRGMGEMDGVTYDMIMTMDFYNNNDGLFVMELISKEKDKDPVTQFKEVGLDFKYVYEGDAKTGAGAIQPKNPDGSDLGDEPQPPYGFTKKDNVIVVNFYDFKNDIGIESIAFVKK
jgi:TonB family protein